jgi:hypothetical protein
LLAAKASGEVVSELQSISPRVLMRGRLRLAKRRGRAEGFAVVFLVIGEEVAPAVADELPEGGGAGAARLVDGRHKEYS